MDMKSRRQLLYPDAPVTKGQRGQTLKHNPLEEYRSSALQSKEGPTLIVVPSVQFKKAMCSAALDLPGASKSQITRLITVVGERTHLYGAPSMYLAWVNEGGMTKTPNIRTRAGMRRWCAEISVRFPAEIVNEKSVTNLLSVAGVFSGVGDGRVQKGGNFGQFRIVGRDDKEYREIVSSGGRKAQVLGMELPTYFDEDSEALYLWFESEIQRRGAEAKLKAKAATA